MKNIKADEKLNMLNHSCAHLLAHAVRHLYPNAKFWVGPVIDSGFYYDIDLGDKLYIPRNMLKADEEIFLDNITLEKLSDMMGIEVVPCLNKGKDFVDKILK